jgi:AcrR family transcriptional regulator
MTQRMTGNGRSKSDKKEFVIATSAAKLFAVKGYTETSLEDVAGISRMSKGAMYHYFRNKSDILDYILSTFMDVVLDNAQQGLAELSDPVERLRIIILRHVKTYVEHPDLAKTLLNEAYNLQAAKLKKIEAKQKEYFALVAQTISSCLRGGIDKDRLTILTFSLLGMCNWIYAWYNPKGNITPEQLSQVIFENFTGSWKRQ